MKAIKKHIYLLAGLACCLSFFSCEKENTHFLKENNGGNQQYPTNNCGDLAVAQQKASGELIATLPAADYQTLWEDMGVMLEPLSPAGGGRGGVMHDITIWPTKALEEQGLSGTLGLSFVLDEAYFAAAPEALPSNEAIEDLPFEAIEGGQWTAVIVDGNGDFVPVSAEELGWSLKAIYHTSTGYIGVIVSIDDVHAPVLEGGGIIIIDELGTSPEVYGAVNYGGIILIEDDVLAFPVPNITNDLQATSASWNTNMPYGELPQLNFEWLNTEGVPCITSVLLNDCAEDDLLY